MGLEKPQSLALRDLIDADALRRDLTALAHETGDPGTLRKSSLRTAETMRAICKASAVSIPGTRARMIFASRPTSGKST